MWRVKELKKVLHAEVKKEKRWRRKCAMKVGVERKAGREERGYKEITGRTRDEKQRNGRESGKGEGGGARWE